MKRRCPSGCAGCWVCMLSMGMGIQLIIFGCAQYCLKFNRNGKRLYGGKKRQLNKICGYFGAKAHEN